MATERRLEPVSGISHVFFDFDSTLVDGEGLDVLAEVVGERVEPAERDRLRERVTELTDLAMEGRVSFDEALARRLEWLRPEAADLARASELLSDRVAPGAVSALAALRAAGKRLAVVSGGLRDVLLPIAVELGFDESDVHCNDVIPGGDTPTVDRDNPLARDGGKVTVIRGLARPEETAMIGDGATDLEVRTEGAAAVFIACTVACERRAVVAAADRVLERFDDLPRLLP